MWIEKTPRFNDDDTPSSWLERLGVHGMKKLYKRYKGDIDKELFELRKDGVNKPIGGLYFTLTCILQDARGEDFKLIQEVLDDIRLKYLGEEVANNINALLDATVIDDEETLPL